MTTAYTVQEQLQLDAQKYMHTPPFTFWGAIAKREGKPGRDPEQFSITAGKWVQREKVEQARRGLAMRDGSPMRELPSGHRRAAAEAVRTRREPGSPPRAKS